MQTRTFRADSLQDALEEIRQQMGSGASVLHTRQVRDGWMGWLGRTYVEVTAEIPTGAETSGEASAAAPNSVDAETDRDLTNRAETKRAETNRLTDTRNWENPSASDHERDVQKAPPQAESPQIIQFPKADDRSDLLPPALKTYRDELLSLGIRPVTVNRWISATTGFAACIDDSLEQPWLDHLQRSVARELRLGGPIRIPPGSRHIVALVGPTGVGKTTTVAKLAAGFRIESKRRVGLLTIDTFRIAAVQQLKAYADIMDLPMQVVENPSEMRPALDTLGDVDLVLIDTAGRSPRSDARIDQLADLLRSAQPDETHLVLSATSSTSAVHAVLEGFAPARPTGAILTKLDEAPQTAGILSAITATNVFAGIPVSYLTNGQQVPDDIAVADAQTLLSRLLPARAAIPRIEAA